MVCGCVHRGVCSKAGACVILSVLILGVLVMGITFLALYTNIKVSSSQFAVAENQYTTDLGSVLTQGTYTLAVGDHLHTFTRTVQDAGLSTMTALSSDLVNVELTVSVQIQYDQHDIIPIIMSEFGGASAFKTFLQDTLTCSILDTSGNFTAADYFQYRGLVENQMLLNAQAALRNYQLMTQVQQVQLKNVEFPNDFNSIILQEQSVNQNVSTLINQRTSALIQANTSLLQAQINVDTLLVNAHNQESIILQNGTVQSNQTIYEWTARTNTYLHVKNALSLNNTQLIGYLRSQLTVNSYAPMVGIASVAA